MKRIIQTLPLLLLLFISYTAIAQQTDAIPGIWKGTSLCQIKNSPCHDETVVYHISSTDTINVYRNIGNKIVNGQEEYMGTLFFTYEPAKQLLISVDKQRNASWELQVKGNKMEGKLIYQGNVYRIVNVEKQNNP